VSDYIHDEFDPEDFEPTPKRVGPLSHRLTAQALFPAALCFLAFAVTSGLYWRQTSVSNMLWVSGETIFVDGEYWRLLSALFTHSDAGHLLSNTPLFLIFGWVLYGYFGRLVFPATAFVLGIATNLWTIYLYPAEVRLVGASGMLYGMIALWLVLYIKFDVDHSLPWRLIRALAFTLIVIFPTTFQPKTSYLAHGIGFLLGLLSAVPLSVYFQKKFETATSITVSPAQDMYYH
jgi:rhomboid protease GluP